MILSDHSIDLSQHLKDHDGIPLPVASLDFKYFPGYAAYLLEHKLEELAVEQLRLSRELKLPLLKYFEVLGDKEMINMGIKGTSDWLESIAKNNATEYILRSLQSWISNQAPMITRNQVMIEDITILSFIKRKVLRDFLHFYVKDINQFEKVMEEVDRFTVELDTSCLRLVMSFQHELYKNAQAIAKIGNWVWDLRTRKLTWSDEVYRIYELDPQEAISEDIAQWNHPDDVEMVIAQMERSRVTLEPHDFYYRVILHNGKEKILHARGEVRVDEKGEANEMYGTLQDVTTQQLHERELKAKEDFIRKIADVTPSLITAYNINTSKYIFVNNSAKKLLGYTAEELMEKGVQFVAELVHPEDSRELSEKNAKALEYANSKKNLEDDEIIVEFEYRLRNKNGEYKWFHTYGTVFSRDRQGRVEAVLNISVDITDQEKAHGLISRQDEQIRMNEERFHKMTDEVQDYAILLLSKEGYIENWNKGAEKIKGYKAAEIVGKHFRTFYTQEDQAAALPENLLAYAAKHGKAIHEGNRVRKDGTYFWGNIVITALHDKQNNIIGFSKVTHDLTDKKIAAEKAKQYALSIEQKNRELEQINKELDSFSYIASHDLQEPLRKIKTFTNLILEKEMDSLSETAKDYFRRSIHASERMQRLIEALLNYSRTNIETIVFEKTDLGKLVNEVKKNVLELAGDKEIVIEISKLPVLNAIPLQMQQLFTNLLDNSIKYRRPGASLLIRIEAEKILAGGAAEFENKEPMHKITISDNGIGFEQQYSKRIFELFQRLHGKVEFQGTGIGLAICKKIVQNHNGFITALGEPGKGATFTVYLPVSN